MTEMMNKINRILTGLTGCQLEFKSIEELNQLEWNTQSLQAGNGDGPLYIEGETNGSFGFPVRAAGQLAGLAIVRDLTDARPAKLKELADLLAAVLSNSLERETRLDSARRVEERLQLAGENTNVVPMRPLRAAQDELDWEPLPEAPVPVDAAISALPLLLEVPEGFPLQRLALDIHQMSARWAFLSLNDLAPNILESREELKALAGITLFIPDVAKLSEQQQRQLTEYLATKPGPEMPQVIAGVSTPTETLRRELRILPRLIDSFCVIRLNWFERREQQVSSDLIDASLQLVLERARAAAIMLNHEAAVLTPANVFRLHPGTRTFH